MSTELDPASHELVARLRAALDEVAATGSARATAEPRPTGASSTWKWAVAAAAGLALVGGSALVLRHNGRQPLQPTAADSLADTTAGTTDGRWSAAPPYTLIAADLPPGPIGEGPCCMDPDEVVLAWARNGDPGTGLVVARATPASTEVSPVTTPTATVVTLGSTALAVDTRGVEVEERATLLASLQPGSGVPFVLAAEGWALIAMTAVADAPPNTQQFGSSVRMSTGVSAEVFFSMVSAPSVREVAVAGERGWALEYTGGYAVVLWQHRDSGRWVSLDIGADMAGRVDGLIAAVAVNTNAVDPPVPTPDTAVTPVDDGLVRVVSVEGATLDTFDPNATVDATVGQAMPTVQTSAGEFMVDGPTLFVFVAHWCAHCNAELPVMVDGMSSNAFDGVRVVLVSTAADASLPNYPAEDWIAASGWTGEVLYDVSADGEDAGDPSAMAQGFGAPAWPYMVAVDANGLVTGRATGEMSLTEVQALAATAGTAGVLGRLLIPSIDVDWYVGAGGAADMNAGPVMATVDGVEYIFGNRTTYGAPFSRLDELQPGDRFTYETVDGVRTFEVTLVESCENGGEVVDLTRCPALPGDDMMLVTQYPEYTDRARLTVHATELPTN